MGPEVTSHSSAAVSVTSRTLVAEGADLRLKNQITIPVRIAKALGLRAGDRLVFEIVDSQPEVVRVHRLRDDYTGALAGVYGHPEEVAAYLREERESWSE